MNRNRAPLAAWRKEDRGAHKEDERLTLDARLAQLLVSYEGRSAGAYLWVVGYSEDSEVRGYCDTQLAAQLAAEDALFALVDTVNKLRPAREGVDDDRTPLVVIFEACTELRAARVELSRYRDLDRAVGRRLHVLEPIALERGMRLDRAICAFTASGPDDGPNDGAREQALERLLDGLESYGRARGKGADDAKWERVRRYTKEYLEAQADAVQELREAWEETRGTE